jgi:hypothetical protein
MTITVGRYAYDSVSEAACDCFRELVTLQDYQAVASLVRDMRRSEGPGHRTMIVADFAVARWDMESWTVWFGDRSRTDDHHWQIGSAHQADEWLVSTMAAATVICWALTNSPDGTVCLN